MGRQIFNFAAVVSLVLCLLCGCVWVRSRFVSDSIEWTAVQRKGPNIITRTFLVRVRDTGERSSIRFIQKEVIAGGIDPLSMDDVWREKSREAGLKYSSPSWTDVELRDGNTVWDRLGFYTNSVSVVQRVHGRMNHTIARAQTTAVPLWALPVAASVVPIVWTTFELRRRGSRRRRGQCIHCGYDLRASPDRCPECGMATAKAASA